MLSDIGDCSGVRGRFAPQQLRHAHAVEMAREGVPLNVIQRQLGHSDLGITSAYLAGISNDEVISAVPARTEPMMPASAGLRFEAWGAGLKRLALAQRRRRSRTYIGVDQP